MVSKLRIIWKQTVHTRVVLVGWLVGIGCSGYQRSAVVFAWLALVAGDNTRYKLLEAPCILE